MEMNFENDLLFTGGKDGSIFRTSLSEIDEIPSTPETENQQQIYDKIFQFDNKKTIITYLKYDPLHEKLWVGTPSSTFHCLDLKASGATDYISVQGLPWITDYHVLRNKRFILTNS